MTDSDNGLWVRRFHPAPAGARRLVCLPHAGGSASFYFPVSRALSPAVEVLAIQYPGRQDRRQEPCVDNLPELARQVFGVLRPWLDQPLAIFGHSMGATLGFEVARLIEAETGASAAHLFPSGRRAPSCPRHETVHLLDDEGLLADVRRLSGTNSAVLGDAELLRAALPAIRNDYRAAETYEYTPGPKLGCPVTVFTGDADPKTTVDEARAWERHTTGAFDLQVFPGGHFFLAQHQPAILRTISAALARTPVS
ncbi:alpha/beta fold hydrolase [Micromonospora harpali]|uniref:Surfactin synthase thioesterase subunit n=2 Tax=Micromonospora TaxID=1873 RepID=A0A1C4XRB3_9ACTN|nr:MULTISPECIES: alpha/beta fold hydrolase [Micromonospora]MDI5939939.1 alpha/beta fold hydrolase [Micromonospora sp. DH15]OON31200.1 thioesterase [Micromonospora sp. Rc5]SCF11035.1 Surfactin synthase thioesterase subunit [Micromonospora haikouensis]